MLFSESTQLVEKLKDLFSRWSPKDAELEAWEQLFAKLDDFNDAQLALTKHWEKCKRLSPVPNDFKNAYNSIRQSREGRKRQSGYGYAGLYIECVIAPVGFPNRLGRKVPVYFGNDRRLDEHEEHYHDVMKIAENMRNQHKTMYGGEWRIINDIRDDSPFKEKRDDEP